VIERRAIGDAPAAIVPGYGETIKTKLVHDAHHVPCHCAL
jgi:hypothetical protein